MSQATPVYEVAIGHYDQTIFADGPIGDWLLGETNGTVAADSSGFGHPGTYIGGYTLNQPGLIADGSAAVALDGVSQNGITIAGLAQPAHISVELVAKRNGAQVGFARLFDTEVDNYFDVLIGGGNIYFYVAFVEGATGFLDSGYPFADGVATHLVATWDGTTLRLSANGAQVFSSAAYAGRTLPNVGSTNIKAFGCISTGAGADFKGTLQKAALYNYALSAAQVLAHYLSGQWTDITSDVVDSGVTSKLGITGGNGPMDSIASTGQCAFLLRNDLATGHPVGYYSPNHASCRAGWTFGVPFRLSFIYNSTTYRRFRGKVYSILPDSGMKNRRQVAVVAYDIMRDLAEVEMNAIGIQVNMTESQIIANVLASLPVGSQPVATDIDAGVDTFPYALDTTGSTSKALSVIADVARSAFMLIACKSDGTLIGRNRHTRAIGTTTATFSSDFMDFQVPSDLVNVYNVVRVTIHPKTVDNAATTVLYVLVGTVPAISPGQTLTLWGSYNDPSNAQRLIGGIAFVTLVAYPTANYDYAGNSAMDGTGTDLTAGLVVVVTPFATTAKFEITNTNGMTVYLIETGGAGPRLRIRGKGVYDRGPQTYQSSSTQPYGTRPIDIDMPYQNDPLVAQAAAQYVLASYKTLANQVQQLSFVANDTAAHMLFALTTEPGDRITVTEPVTGIVAIDAIVQSVSLSVIEKIITVVLTLAPANVFRFWQWGITGRSEWGSNTVYGF